MLAEICYIVAYLFIAIKTCNDERHNIHHDIMYVSFNGEFNVRLVVQHFVRFVFVCWMHFCGLLLLLKDLFCIVLLPITRQPKEGFIRKFSLHLCYIICEQYLLADVRPQPVMTQLTPA